MLQLCVMLTNPLAIHAVNIRQAFLCEAKNRVENLLGRVHLLESPNMQNGISLQITRQQAPCGGNDVPITIGHFTIEGAEVEDAFNALTDTRKVWDPLVDSSIKLGQFPDQQAIGLALSFTAHPFQDREFYEWMVVNTTDPSDLWVVYSTLSNDALHLIKPRARSKVEAQNCLEHTASKGAWMEEFIQLSQAKSTLTHSWSQLLLLTTWHGTRLLSP